jgi:hypothetical protein
MSRLKFDEKSLRSLREIEIQPVHPAVPILPRPTGQKFGLNVLEGCTMNFDHPYGEALWPPSRITPMTEPKTPVELSLHELGVGSQLGEFFLERHCTKVDLGEPGIHLLSEPKTHPNTGKTDQ